MMGTGFTGAAKHIASQRMLQGCRNTSQLLAKASRGACNLNLWMSEMASGVPQNICFFEKFFRDVASVREDWEK